MGEPYNRTKKNAVKIDKNKVQKRKKNTKKNLLDKTKNRQK